MKDKTMAIESYNVVIEGPDNTGKTTLANYILKNHADMEYVKVNAVTSYNEGKNQNYGLLYDLNHKNGVIYDRFIFGEAVYGPILRNYYPSYIHYINQQLPGNTLLIYLTADIQTLYDRFDNKFILKEHIPLIHAQYERDFLYQKYPIKCSTEEIYNVIKEVCS